MNVIVNEGFFADVVVVVEGMTEIGILWKMQEILEADWVRKGIVIVPANGKNNIDRPVVIFRGFSIPTYFIFDGDAKGKGKKDEKETKRRNQRYLKLAQVTPEDFPETQVKEKWAVFHNDIEGLIEDTVTTDVYREIRGIVAEELCYNKQSQAVKNIDGAARLIGLVYERGYKIPKIEKIIQRISQLSV